MEMEKYFATETQWVLNTQKQESELKHVAVNLELCLHWALGWVWCLFETQSFFLRK